VNYDKWIAEVGPTDRLVLKKFAQTMSRAELKKKAGSVLVRQEAHRLCQLTGLELTPAQFASVMLVLSGPTESAT
jgi:hypothetical protein